MRPDNESGTMQELEELKRAAALFPHLANSGVQATSPRTKNYNCIAWAAGETNKWWWPRGPKSYWPSKAPRSLAVNTFITVFADRGYESCDDGDLQEGFEKVAIYAERGNVTHMARQLPSGQWTSKMGRGIDIEHETLEALEGGSYGAVVHYMRRVLSEDT